jgi:transcriptional regulator with XRE-family HTH domain
VASDQAPAVADHFGENLRRARRRQGLSQEKLANRASLHRTEIGMLEHGQRICRIDTLIRLAGALTVPAGELLDGIDWIPGPEPSGTFAFAFGSSSIPPRPSRDEPRR